MLDFLPCRHFADKGDNPRTVANEAVQLVATDHDQSELGSATGLASLFDELDDAITQKWTSRAVDSTYQPHEVVEFVRSVVAQLHVVVAAVHLACCFAETARCKVGATGESDRHELFELVFGIF